jgi:hypothetical protein
MPLLRRRPGRGSLLMTLVLATALAPALARAQGSGADTLVLRWTATGDDGNVGTAASYEIRFSQSPINNNNWSSATVIGGPPAPQVAGTRQTTVVRGLARGTTYYFAIRATDDAGNESGLSNVARWDWVLDTAPPAAPGGITAAREGTIDARVRWSANSEPDLAGYTVYRSFDAGGPWTAVTTGLTTATEFLDTSVPDNTEAAWYRVTASDLSGNESAPSAAQSVSFGTQTQTPASAWTLDPGYPNPSNTSTPVRVPFVVPPTGPGSAVLEIVDSGGHTVRRFDLHGLAPGIQNVLWDGTNQSGRLVGPGVYTAWLSGVDKRRSVKLVRVP